MRAFAPMTAYDVQTAALCVPDKGDGVSILCVLGCYLTARKLHCVQVSVEWDKAALEFMLAFLALVPVLLALATLL
jgi:hypothetical protein